MANHQVGNMADVPASRGVGNEVQTITGGATSGTFQLDFAGQKTTALTFDDTAADIQTALRALSNISATGVVCAGGALPAAVTVSFSNEFAGADVPKLIVRSIGLAGGTVTVATTTGNTKFNDSDMLTIAAMRARLTAINSTTYSAARLETMTENDMRYALRVQDSLNSV